MSTGLALVGLNCAVAAITVAGAVYFARVRMPRPPVGTYELPDVVAMTAVVVAAPLVYLAVPRTAVAVVFGLVLCVALQFTLAPLIGGGRAWLAAAVSVAATAGCAFADLPVAVTALTDVLLAIAVVGVANMWAQSGLRSVHAAWFAGLLCCYDLVATGLTSVMDRFAAQVMGLPFAPLLAVTQDRPPVALGLGDLLLLVLFPLVALKAFGRAAGLLAAGRRTGGVRERQPAVRAGSADRGVPAPDGTRTADRATARAVVTGQVGRADHRRVARGNTARGGGRHPHGPGPGAAPGPRTGRRGRAADGAVPGRLARGRRRPGGGQREVAWSGAQGRPYPRL
ncbi:hypothetical protein [Streptomyces sp. NPDC055094]